MVIIKLSFFSLHSFLLYLWPTTSSRETITGKAWYKAMLFLCDISLSPSFYLSIHLSLLLNLTKLMQNLSCLPHKSSLCTLESINGVFGVDFRLKPLASIYRHVIDVNFEDHKFNDKINVTVMGRNSIQVKFLLKLMPCLLYSRSLEP
jgi:hypothetical protein